MPHTSKHDDSDILEVLTQLRAEKSRRKLSNDDIVELLRKNNIALDPKTVQKVFKVNGTETNFRRHTLQTIAIAMDLDLVNQRTNRILLEERNQLEKDLLATREKMQAAQKSLASLTDTVSSMAAQIESMRTTIRGNEDHIRERDRQIELLAEQNRVMERNSRRKDGFLHIYTVSCLGAALTGCVLFASGVLNWGRRK